MMGMVKSLPTDFLDEVAWDDDDSEVHRIHN